jgi:hypothetical protein
VKQTDTAVDLTDDEFCAAFLQYMQEKNGSGLTVEQLDRLNAESPLLNMKYLLLNMEGGICWSLISAARKHMLYNIWHRLEIPTIWKNNSTSEE